MKKLMILLVLVMKANFKLLIALVLISALFTSCSKSDDGDLVFKDTALLRCTDAMALNYKLSTDATEGVCRYSSAAFFAKLDVLHGVRIESVIINVNDSYAGSITNGLIWPDGPEDCRSAGTVLYQFLDSNPVDWNATLFLANGQKFYTGGTVYPNSTIECFKINVTIE